MTYSQRVELFAVAEAVRVVRENGPQMHFLLKRHVVKETRRFFDGGPGWSRGGVAACAFDDAVRRGVFRVSWDHVPGGEPRPHVVSFWPSTAEADA